MKLKDASSAPFAWLRSMEPTTKGFVRGMSACGLLFGGSMILSIFLIIMMHSRA